MKRVKKTYVGQLSQSEQDNIRKQLKNYGLSESEIEDAMNSKISDITGNPECPITIESSIQVSGYDDACRKLNNLKDGDVIEYSGDKLGGVLSAVADSLEVGDLFDVSAMTGYISPGPDSGHKRQLTTTFLVTDEYRYGNGFAPIYNGRHPPLNSNKSRSWRDISSGALWLLNGAYTITIHKQYLDDDYIDASSGISYHQSIEASLVSKKAQALDTLNMVKDIYESDSSGLLVAGLYSDFMSEVNTQIREIQDTIVD